MTTMIATSGTGVATPTSYVSRWVAQSHGNYQKNANEYYASLSSSSSSSSSSSPSLSYDCRTSTTILPILKVSSKINTNVRTTTWQAQAKLRFDNAADTIDTDSSLNRSANTMINNELQEKLNRIRTLLDAKKQRICRYASSASTTSSITTNIPLTKHCTFDQTPNITTVGDQLLSSSTSSPPPPPMSSHFSSAPVALENIYHSQDESLLSSNSTYVHNSSYHNHHHNHHHMLPSVLPCLMEESPSDSGLSDGTKTTTHDDTNEQSNKSAAIVDLTKPLSKEEMLAIVQIIRELWKKQFRCDMPNIQLSSTVPATRFNNIGEKSNTSQIQYCSTSSLNKLHAELNDIKDKIKRFSTQQQQQQHSCAENKSAEMDHGQLDIDHSSCNENAIFTSLDKTRSPQDLERIRAKKDCILQRQSERREEQLVKKQERQAEAVEHCDEHRLFEEYLTQRRQQDEQRRTNILQAHLEQKRFEQDSFPSNDYFFAAARNRNRLKRKSSMSSFLSFDDDNSFNSSLNLFQTRKLSSTCFDSMSPSLTAPTAASRSKMNRAASISNINGHYDSFRSLNSKETIPSSVFGGSLMNLSKGQNLKRRSLNLIDDPFQNTQISTSMTSLATSLTGSRITRSQTLLTTKSNKQAILNSLKQVALAGSANERQRETIVREIELSEARHFVLLFRDHRLQFRAVYVYIPETDTIEKLYGMGPNTITEIMVDKWFKYNSGSKRFTSIPIKHFSIQCDAIIIYNDFWQKKFLTNTN